MPANSPALHAARTERMTALLQEQLQPDLLELRDESHLHAGHNAEAAAGGTHYRLTIASVQLNGLSRIAQHRLINQILAGEFAAGLHALAIVVKPV